MKAVVLGCALQGSLFLPVALHGTTVRDSIDLSESVVLNEVMYNPIGPESHDEFIELVNTSQTEWLDLTGWRLGDADELDQLEGAGDGLLLAPGQFGLVLDGSYFGQSATYDSMRGKAVMLTIDDRAFGRAGWSNSSAEVVILCNPQGDTLDQFAYEPTGKAGLSWERVDLTAQPGRPNWAPSLIVGGTPGAPNSVGELTVGHPEIEAEPDPFSEAVDIAFSLPGAPALVSIWMYDIEGQRLRTLLEGEETGPRGQVRWDGEDGDGRAVPAGMYIAYLEAGIGGRVFRSKRVIVRRLP